MPGEAVTRLHTREMERPAADVTAAGRIESFREYTPKARAPPYQGRLCHPRAANGFSLAQRSQQYRSAIVHAVRFADAATHLWAS